MKTSVDPPAGTADALQDERDILVRRLEEADERIASLNRIGIALSAERDVERLLERILSESRRFTRSEAGSLYLVEDGPSGRCLRFRLAQNEAIRFAFTERTVHVDESSLAGFVALRKEPLVLDDAYRIPEKSPYRHNAAFDTETGWRTRAVLVVPMCDHAGELVGVLQLMNRRDPAGTGFEAYPADLVSIVLSLATQAAVCLQASRLTEGMRKLFEDFAQAAIFAVEQRDPTTAGHSIRVAGLTETLARLVDRADDGPYSDVRFSVEELREIRTAALLHDFGKIAIPERVLVKAKKLDEETTHRLRDRFDLALQSEDLAACRDLLERLVAAHLAPVAEDLRLLDVSRSDRAREMQEQFEEILRANEPTVLPRESGGKLRALLTRTWKDRRGVVSPLLDEDEFVLLSIPRGSLSEPERGAIESHVMQTYRFLSSIPWTQDLRRVPEIAYAHHEKLDGTGYPRGLRSGEIPVPSRIMTICDIYDALTASDRPYKKAVPREASLGILEDEARQGLLDPWMVRTFIDEGVWASGGVR